jgi:hypothetical protein
LVFSSSQFRTPGDDHLAPIAALLARVQLCEPCEVDREQGAHAFELRAALLLAKLYQSTGRPINAHDVLGPALKGFAPTPEFPTIGRPRLFEALAHLRVVLGSALE